MPSGWTDEADAWLLRPQRRSARTKALAILSASRAGSSTGDNARSSLDKDSSGEERGRNSDIRALIKTVDGASAEQLEAVRTGLTNLLEGLCLKGASTDFMGTPQFHELVNKMLFNNSLSDNWLVLDQGNKIVAHYHRYEQDFSDLGRLGKGAFGEVCKARSKLDQCYYAVKKIRLGPKHSPPRVLAEVLLMAKLDHPHIVRYHNAWIQLERTSARMHKHSESKGAPKIVEILSTASANSIENGEHQNPAGEPIFASEDSYNPSFSASNGVVRNKFFRRKSSSNESTEDTQGSSLDQLKRCSDIHTQGHPEKSKITISNEEVSSLQISHSRREVVQYLRQPRPEAALQQTIIFIQMELCERTLTTFLVERNEGAQGELLPQSVHMETLFFAGNLMSATSYLHAKGVIHRDIKPSNIFLASGDFGRRLKLGDFGLACYDSAQDAPAVLQVTQGGGDLLGHSRGVGTALYAAPEQVKSRTYNFAADVYSCGLVLIELFSLFKTDMERTTTLERARQGFVPQYIDDISRDLFLLIVTMLLQTCDARPSSDEALRRLECIEKNAYSIAESSDECISRLQSEVAELRCTVAILENNCMSMKAQMETEQRRRVGEGPSKEAPF